MTEFENKVETLRRRLRELESAVVAFSGGVDSSVLVVTAREVLGAKMIAATAVSPSAPRRDLDLAGSLCRERAIPHRFVNSHEFFDAAFTANPPDRCYYCKCNLYAGLVSLADEMNFRFVVEGTNASDLGGHRPGHRASRENARVATPLIDAGLTKEEVRNLAASFGLPTADKPSSACLASRVPTGTAIEPELMRRIDEAEEFLRALGAGQVRVRHHGETARIEVDPRDMNLCVSNRIEINEKLAGLGWKRVSLDLAGYKNG